MPDDSPYQHRNSTLFTKKHTKGRLNQYNIHVYKMQKKMNKDKYTNIVKPSRKGMYVNDLIDMSPRGFTTDLI